MIFGTLQRRPTSFYFEPIRWFHIHQIHHTRWRHLAKINNSNFAFDECLTGVYHNMFGRTSLDKLLNSSHQNQLWQNCANWCWHFKDMVVSMQLSHLICRWKRELFNIIAIGGATCVIILFNIDLTDVINIMLNSTKNNVNLFSRYDISSQS